MNLIFGVDYQVYPVTMPNCGGIALVTPDADGTCSVYLNDRHSTALQRRGLCHELRHMALDHFSRSGCPLSLLERSARAGRAL